MMRKSVDATPRLPNVWGGVGGGGTVLLCFTFQDRPKVGWGGGGGVRYCYVSVRSDGGYGNGGTVMILTKMGVR